MENVGEQPDIEVPLSPDDYLNDRDPQIDKAIEVLANGSIAQQ
jgi:C-terminal processing protease CtpA/Prc